MVEAMETEKGFKKTDVGFIPSDWDIKKIGDCLLRNPDYGINAAAVPYNESLPVYLRITDITEDGKYSRKNLVSVNNLSSDSYYLQEGDLVFARTGASVGKTYLYNKNDGKLVFAGFLIRVKTNEKILLPDYLKYFTQTKIYWNWIAANSMRTGQPGINGNEYKELFIPLPPTKAEQAAIAETLNDADALIAELEKLITKKAAIKQGAMQELLTGKKRLPGFSGDWDLKKIDMIASPCSEKNIAAEDLPVLTCSKHLGFVDSLRYFKNQIFSKDTSNYKIIRRGQIGYPANHVEEGSIGLQNLYDKALVSPIYVVFSVMDRINSYFLHRLLKLDSYRQIFKTATTSTVDRRGSLRWPAFSVITVRIPSFSEQNSIAEILSDIDAEIEALEKKLDKYKMLKQGMMQNLLTGKIRLI